MNILTIKPNKIAKKYVPKDMHKNVQLLLDKMLRQEATYIEKNGNYKSTIVSSIKNVNNIEFNTKRIPPTDIIKKENVNKGDSFLRVDGTEFVINNDTGLLSTTSKHSIEKTKELLKKGNDFIKSALENFHSEKLTKKQISIIGLVIDKFKK